MSKAKEPIISNCEKKFVSKALADYTRLDGRAFEEFRDLSIHFGKDWGCCYVTLGKTKVVAQVSCEIQQPKSSRPSEGLLNINLELNPMGAPHFEPGRQSELSIQLNRLMEKCIKDSKAVDLESLCIKVNEKVWALRVDVNVLNHEGNILDCASVAAITALAHFRRPDVTSDGEDIIIHTYAQRDPIPTVIHHYPVSITFAIFNNGEFILSDPTLLEEGVAEAYISVALNAYKELCSLHLGGSALMRPDLILQTTHKASVRANKVISVIKKVIEEDNGIRAQRKEVGFHQNLLDLDKEISLKNLETYLDQWNIQKSKGSKRKQIRNVDVDGVKDIKNNSANVKSLGKASAELMPKESVTEEVWTISSDEESEEEVMVNQPVKHVEKMQEENSVGDGSEEDEVVVINRPNKKTKHKD